MASPKLRTVAARIWDENNFWNGRARLQWTLQGHWERPCFSDWSCFGAHFATTMKRCWCCNAKKNLFFSCWANLQAAIHSDDCGGVLRRASPNLPAVLGASQGTWQLGRSFHFDPRLTDFPRGGKSNVRVLTPSSWLEEALKNLSAGANHDSDPCPGRWEGASLSQSRTNLDFGNQSAMDRAFVSDFQQSMPLGFG